MSSGNEEKVVLFVVVFEGKDGEGELLGGIEEVGEEVLVLGLEIKQVDGPLEFDCDQKKMEVIEELLGLVVFVVVLEILFVFKEIDGQGKGV